MGYERLSHMPSAMASVDIISHSIVPDSNPPMTVGTDGRRVPVQIENREHQSK